MNGTPTPLVVSTPSRIEWAGVVFLCVYALLPVWLLLRSPRTSDAWVFFGVITPLFLIGALYLAFRQLTYRIVATEDGISWRLWQSSGQAMWADVRDYYNEASNRRSSGYNSKIVAGRTSIGFNIRWTHSAELKAAVERHATAAKAKAWGCLGARDEDGWPQTFGYSLRKAKRSLNTLVSCVVLVIGGDGWLATFCMVARHKDGFSIAMFGFTALVLTLYGALISTSPWLTYKELRRRKSESIIVDRETLTFTSGEDVTAASWSDVIDYYWTTSVGGILKISNQARVETRSGPICFFFEIDDCPRLTKIVETYATNAAHHKWRTVSACESLEPRQSPWNGDSGGKRYSYRSRTVRILLAIPAVYVIAPFVVAASQYCLGLPVATTRLCWIGGPSLLLLGYGLAVFYRSAIVLDDNEITKITPFGKTRVVWNDVTEVKVNLGELIGGSFVKSERRTLPISSLLNNVADLIAEIQKHAVNATIRKDA
jgi:hypothetical protein